MNIIDIIDTMDTMDKCKLFFLALSALFSALFVGVFLCKIIKEKFDFNISKSLNKDTSEPVLNKYIGTESFFYKKKNKEEINTGIKKYFRFLYLTYFSVCVLTLILSIFLIIGIFKNENYEMTNWRELEISGFSITAEVEKENADYERQEFITTHKDSLPFSLVLKYKSTWIDFRYPIDDTVRVNFVKFGKEKINDSVITLKSNKYGIELECKISRETNLNYKDIKYRADPEKNGYIIRTDTNEYVHKIIRSYPESAIMYQRFFNEYEPPPTLRDSLITLFIKNEIEKRAKKEEDKLIDSCTKEMVNDNINSLRKEKNFKEKEKNFTKEKRESFREKEKDKLKKDSLRIDTLTKSKQYRVLKEEIDSFTTKGIDSLTTKRIIDSLSKITEEIKITEKIKIPKKVKPKLTQTKNWYFTIASILSLFANVFYLLLFGFFNIETKLFTEERKSDVYRLYTVFVFGIFIIISLILFLDAYCPWYSNYSPIFSPSFLFVIRLIIALTSTIAVFGCWGSMNNLYTSFPWFFKFLMFFYAMSNFFELNLHYTDTPFNQVAELFLYFVGATAKIYVIYILLCWAPKYKRILWYSFTSINNFRTKNDYDNFVKIFDILKLEHENSELKRRPPDDPKKRTFDDELLKLKIENVILKEVFADVQPDHRIIKEIKDN